MTTPAGGFFYSYDGLGSVAGVTSASGAPVWSYLYEPYGVALALRWSPAAPANQVRFTGQLYDTDTGLYHLRARAYDPATGRFLQPDPLPAPFREPAVSAYAYADDRPTVLVDPSGLAATAEESRVGWSNLALDVAYGAGIGLRARASSLSTTWRWSSSPALRSAAAGQIRRAGQISRFSTRPGFRIIPWAAAGVQFTGAVARGQSPWAAGFRTGATVAGSEIGGAFGAAACGLAVAATAGGGSVACPVAVGVFSAAGAYFGNKAADLIGGLLGF